MIESTQNQFIKDINSLKLKKYRDEQGRFVIEGAKFIREIPKDWTIESCIVSESFAGGDRLRGVEAEIVSVTDKVFSRISSEESPQGVMAVVKKREWSLKDMLYSARPPYFIVAAERLQDPGNIGAVIRTAHALGAHGVILSKEGADIYNPKTLRATAGSFFHIPVLPETDLLQAIPVLKQAGIKIVASHLREEGCFPYTADFTVSFALLLGSEGQGLSEEALGLADACVKIPMPGGMESLNAGVAAGILMYEALRQRLYCVTIQSS